MNKGRQRSQKFYFKNEADVMRELGFRPSKGSGSGWVEKEDGENEQLIAQLKSTDKQSYKLNKLDIEKLEYNAMVANKIPMFILQFLSDNSRYALVNIDDIPVIADYIKTGEKQQTTEQLFDIKVGKSETKVKSTKKVKSVKSDRSAREQFYNDRQKYNEEKKWKK